MGCSICIHKANMEVCCLAYWMFNKNTTILIKDQAIMIYRVGKGLPINLGQFVFNAIMKTSIDVDSSLLYPNMIF